MDDIQPKRPSDVKAPASRRRSLRWWFVGGYAIVFVGLLFYPVWAMHRSGQSLQRQWLAAYYADVMPRLFGPSTLGPGSIRSGDVVARAAEHVGISVVGGLLALGVGWGLRRRAARA